MVDQINKVLQGAIPVVLLLVTLALILGIGSQVIDTTQVLYDTDDANVDVVNETTTVTFNVLDQLVNTIIDNTTVVVTNGTVTFDQSFWEMSAAQAVLGQINISNSVNDGDLVNITYTFQSQNKNAAFNATQDGLAGMTTFSNFQPTIAVIVVAVLVVAILLVGFAVVGRRVL